MFLRRRVWEKPRSSAPRKPTPGPTRGRVARRIPAATPARGGHPSGAREPLRRGKTGSGRRPAVEEGGWPAGDKASSPRVSPSPRGRDQGSRTARCPAPRVPWASQQTPHVGRGAGDWLCALRGAGTRGPPASPVSPAGSAPAPCLPPLLALGPGLSGCISASVQLSPGFLLSLTLPPETRASDPRTVPRGLGRQDRFHNKAGF